MISFDAERRLWLLSTPGTSYAFRLTPGDAPRHVHWGVRLPPGQAAQVAELQPEPLRFLDRGADEEIVVDGGDRHAVPSLQVRFADGARALEWHYAGHLIDGGTCPSVSRTGGWRSRCGTGSARTPMSSSAG
ncbi:hypothetical protein [Nonomuraea endophytica]|uniref:hypothetical protein n=1 Tax=Nonomuraea endophytica TaxID=714136 RepID=UPI0037C614F8